MLVEFTTAFRSGRDGGLNEHIKIPNVNFTVAKKKINSTNQLKIHLNENY